MKEFFDHEEGSHGPRDMFHNCHAVTDAFIEATLGIPLDLLEAYFRSRRVTYLEAQGHKTEDALRHAHLMEENGEPDMKKDIRYTEACHRKDMKAAEKVVPLLIKRKLHLLAQKIFLCREELALISVTQLSKEWDLTPADATVVLDILKQKGAVKLMLKDPDAYEWVDSCIWKMSETLGGRKAMWRFVQSLFGSGPVSASSCFKEADIFVKLSKKEARLMREFVDLDSVEGALSHKMAVAFEKKLKKQGPVGPVNTSVILTFAEVQDKHETEDGFLCRIRDEFHNPLHYPRISQVTLTPQLFKIMVDHCLPKLMKDLEMRANTLGAAVKDKPLSKDVKQYRIQVLVRQH